MNINASDSNLKASKALRAKAIEAVEVDGLLKKHKISDAEYARVLEVLGRVPTMAELGCFSAMWSEHCSYKSSRVHLSKFPTTGENVIVGPGENAGVVRIEGKLCAAFKMESHNHPSFLEPFHGAATGVGGILRDVFCMGARPIANLNSLRFGSGAHPKTKNLITEAVRGIAHYGNCIGVPTVAGGLSFDSSYDNNCLVNAMTVGLVHEDKIFKGFASGLGNYVVYVGSATGRDGIHGASMSSDSFSKGEKTSQSTVQVGDPYAEKLLLEATLEVLGKGLVVGIQDMGAAGLTSSTFEMAGRAGNGVEIFLEDVPLRANGMTAYEILLSESQERMLMVVKPEDYQELASVLAKWQLSFAKIGRVTDTGRAQIYFNKVLEVDVAIGPMTDAAPKYQKEYLKKDMTTDQVVSRTKDFEEKLWQEISSLFENKEAAKDFLLKLLSQVPSVNSLFEKFDRTIGQRTVLASDHSGAAVLHLGRDLKEEYGIMDSWLGISMTAGCNEKRVKRNPFVGASEAVLQNVRAHWAAGATPLAITDCLNFGNVNDPHVMAELVGSIEGITKACLELGIPVVSGNVSLYNATDGRSISPTPMIGVVGKVNDVRSSRPAIMVDQLSDVWLLSPKDAAGHFCATTAEEVLAAYDFETSQPNVNWKEELNAKEILESLGSDNGLLAVRPVGRAGVFGAAVKFIVEGVTRSDASLEGVLVKFLTEPARLVSERGSSYVVQISKHANFEKCMSVALSRGFSLEKIVEIGKVGVSGGLHVANTYIGWHEILEALKVDKNLAELVPE